MNGLIKKGRALQAFLAALAVVMLCSFSNVATAQVRPAQCEEYTRATQVTLTRGRNVSILTMLATAWEGLNDAEATGYLNRGETPRRVLLRSAWPLRDESIASAWAPPHANVPLLTMGQLVLGNPGRWTTRYHKIFVVDLPEAVHVARSLSVSVTENVRELPATPVQIGYRRDRVDVTTLGHLVDQPSTTAINVEQLFTANASWFHLPTGAVTRRVSSNWKVETLTGISDRSRTFSIRRIGARRALQRSCEALPRVDGVIAGEDRAQLAELLVELDGVGSDPDAHADLQSAVTVAHARVVTALSQQLRPDREAIASANRSRDGWQNAATSYRHSAESWQRTFRGYRAMIIRNTVVGGSLALALIVALIGAIMWLKKRPLPPPSSEVVAEIRRAFLEELLNELVEFRNLAHSYLDNKDPMYKKVLDMSPATVIAGIMEDPAAFFAAVSRAVSAEIGRKTRITPVEPMPAAKVGKAALAAPKAETGQHKAASMTEILCRRILATAGEDVAETISMSDLARQAVNAWDVFIAKVKADALAAHTCPTTPPTDKALMEELEELVELARKACGMSTIPIGRALTVEAVKTTIAALKAKIDAIETSLALVARAVYEVEPSTTELASETDPLKLGEYVLRAISKIKDRISNGVTALAKKEVAVTSMKAGFKRLGDQLNRFSSSVQKALPMLDDGHPAKAIIRDALTVVHLKEEHKKTEKYRAVGKSAAGDDSGEIATSQEPAASTA